MFYYPEPITPLLQLSVQQWLAVSATGPLVFFGGPCHGGSGLPTPSCTRSIYTALHTRSTCWCTCANGQAADRQQDRWRKEYTRNTLEIVMRYPRRSTFDRERDSGTSYGGRPRIGTYLLINLYRLFRTARTNRNTDVEKRREGQPNAKPSSALVLPIWRSMVCG